MDLRKEAGQTSSASRSCLSGEEMTYGFAQVAVAVGAGVAVIVRIGMLENHPLDRMEIQMNEIPKAVPPQVEPLIVNDGTVNYDAPVLSIESPFSAREWAAGVLEFDVGVDVGVPQNILVTPQS